MRKLCTWYINFTVESDLQKNFEMQANISDLTLQYYHNIDPLNK